MPITSVEIPTEVDDNKITANIEAGDDPGFYYAEFTYTVGSDIGKARLSYQVI